MEIFEFTVGHNSYVSFSVIVEDMMNTFFKRANNKSTTLCTYLFQYS
jgi:hypothetical protein